MRTGVVGSDDFGDDGLADLENNYWGLLLGDNRKVMSQSPNGDRMITIR